MEIVADNPRGLKRSKASHFHARAHHAKVRAFERFGFEFSTEQLVRFRARIKGSMAEPDMGCVLLYRQGRNLTHWAVWHGAEWVPLVYDEAMNAVVTFLPPTHIRRHKRKLPW